MNTNRVILIVACAVLLLTLAIAQTLPLRTTLLRSASPQSTPQRQPPKAQVSKERDPALYDEAGPFTLDKETSKQAHKTILTEVRGFLWDHWQQKRHAHLVIKSKDIADQPISSEFYVEPDDEGRWHIALESIGGAEKFYVIERIEVPEDEPPTLPGKKELGKHQGQGDGIHLKQSEEVNMGVIL